MYILASSSSDGGAGILSMVIMMVAVIAILWFFMIRPQNKEKKRMEALLAQVEVGDAVVTQSGFYGIVIDVSEDDVIVEFGSNRNCRIPMMKQAIAQVEKPGDAVEKKTDSAKK